MIKNKEVYWVTSDGEEPTQIFFTLGNAEWPKGTLLGDALVTQDDHETREQAEAVCNQLRKYGFGMAKEVFPIQTWVEELK